jgi:23S rRNA (guanine2445-N2)-methyltransferase / 23S rRNA (guanine2069-N7)-methyltransferase
MFMNYSLFVSCAKGLEYLLEEECHALGLQITQVSPQGVYGQASIHTLYQLCIWSRLANRVQLMLFSGQAHNEQTLYKLCHDFHWQTVFSPDKTLAIEFHGSSTQIRNTMYGAQVVKDAIVDHFKKLVGLRPTIDKTHPQIRIHVHLKNEVIQVSFDLTGYSMHQRGYRTQAGEAPLKETLAAAMLIRAKWPELSAKGYALQDPFCGSGTLAIEAAMMAGQVAPGLIREDQSLVHWAEHEDTLWKKLRVQALEQVKTPASKIQGTDNNQKLISLAETNAERAGVLELISFEHQALKDIRPIAAQGLLICNPPYGERLGEVTELIPLYQELGNISHTYFQNWQLALLTSNPMLAKAIGLKANKQYTLFNGPIECKLYCISIESSNQLKSAENTTLSNGATMLLNRLKKNMQHLKKWVKKNQIQAYRIYDADLPEYSYAIDIYKNYAVLQEYAAPKDIPLYKVEKRSLEVMQVVPLALEIPSANLVIKQRKQQKGKNQYQKLNQSKKTMEIREGNAKLQVNLYDYLDTGLFLDHRLLRLEFEKLPKGTRFLNCFCYTASASVHAALAGAMTTNVDLSNTYLSWAKENFQLNNLDINRHQFVQFNCLEWLKICKDKFDVIFLDPPSFSNSKRMNETLDIQRDHTQLIDSAMLLLAKDGVLYFSTNLKKFKLDTELEDRYTIHNISAKTIDADFQNRGKVHQCFTIRQ